MDNRDYSVVIQVIDEVSTDNHYDSFENEYDGIKYRFDDNLLLLDFNGDWSPQGDNLLSNHVSVQFNDLFTSGCDELVLKWENADNQLSVQCKITDLKQQKRKVFLEALRAPEGLLVLEMDKDVKAQIALMQGCANGSYSSLIHDWIINQL